MTVRTSPRNRLSVHAGGSLLARQGGARRAAAPCLAALALVGTLAACGESRTGNRGSEADPLAEPVGETAIRAADCNGTGIVANLPAEDGFLAVRAGPSTNYSEIARLSGGAEIHLCTPAKDNRWVGVVYRPDGDLPDAARCRLTTDDSPRYEGPCRSGWVPARYLLLAEKGEESVEPVVDGNSAFDNDAAAGGTSNSRNAAQIDQLGNDILLSTPGTFTAGHQNPDRNWTITINNQININGCSMSLRVRQDTRSRENRTTIQSVNFDMRSVSEFQTGSSSSYNYHYTNIVFPYGEEGNIVDFYSQSDRRDISNSKDNIIALLFDSDIAAKEVMLKLREMQRLCS
ncbi:hypothetical protein OIK40_11080 [Erythrobacter sp. sf7]|uniref:SH3b domain-containing protein n=1 Tax=Erythrobacter fulvus TaxID=2987523 RepID=A0ABT5JRP0_9SPHN|nr:hypothetical protein [Erythrobacter fulvus]MDC8755181.1 hypothetical protein [Erythrobacter fulvus]